MHICIILPLNVMHIYVIIYSTTEQKQPNEAESSSQNYEPYTCED